MRQGLNIDDLQSPAAFCLIICAPEITAANNCSSMGAILNIGGH